MAQKKDAHNSGIIQCFVCDTETEEVLKNTPLKEYSLSCEVHQGGIKAAIKYLKTNRSPQILVVDLSDSKLPITDVSALAEACEPGVEVITIGARNDVGVFRELVNLGVRDYLVKPLSTNHFMRSIESVASVPHKIGQSGTFSKSGKLVCFIGGQGGVGTSTLAANCAWSLAETHQKRVGLIDLDLQLGTIPQLLDIEPSAGMQELFETPDRIDEVLLERYMTRFSDHLMVLAAQMGLRETPHITGPALDSILTSLNTHFHYVIADLPRYFYTPTTLSVLQKANTVVVVTDYSLPGLKDTNRILEALKETAQVSQDVFVVANCVGEYKTGALDRATFEESLQRKVHLEIGFDNTRPMKALTEGTPVASQGGGPLSAGIVALTDQMLGREGKEKKSKNIFSMFGK